MIERTVAHYGRLVFERNGIVRAALRAYVECFVAKLPNCLGMPSLVLPTWKGDFQRGALLNDNGCGGHEVVAWTEAGIVALAYDLGSGPIEQLDLPVDAVTGGPDDVRGAVLGLPEELEPAFVMAVGLLIPGNDGEALAGAGFWLYGDQVGGTLFTFDDWSYAHGTDQLACWGLRRNDRLPHACGGGDIEFHDEVRDAVQEAPIHAVIDAVVARRLQGPTELTADELTVLIRREPDPKELLDIQQRLQEVGITWPGSPKLPEKPPEPKPRRVDTGYINVPTTSVRTRNPDYRVFFDRDSIVRAALRAFIESTLARLDPLDRHSFAASFVPNWTGNLQQGAFRSTDENGSYEVLAWSDEGVVGLAYENGFGPVEHLELPITDVKGGPDDVRIAVTEMPAELEPTLVMAVDLLDIGKHGEKLASVGCWLHGELIGGSLNEYYYQMGKERLRAWGKLKKGQLRRWYQGSYVLDLGRTKAAPIQALVDGITERALVGPTELTVDEIATLLPVPVDAEILHTAQRLLQPVGITLRHF